MTAIRSVRVADGKFVQDGGGISARSPATGARCVELAVRGAEWRRYAVANGLSGDWSRARRYGVSPQNLHALYLQQDGRCYLCRDPLPANLAKSHVDHDHSCCPPGNVYKIGCGKCVRGIACASCNRLIGEAHDDPDRLRRIADNLEAANRRVGRSERT